MKYRLVTTTPDFKIIDEWESSSVSVKAPTVNGKSECTYEELLEQRDRLAEAIERYIAEDYTLVGLHRTLAAVEGGQA